MLMPENKGTFPEVIDSTIRAAFVSCPTKWFWSFCRGLQPAGGSVDLIAGGAFAKGLETVRKAVWSDGLSFQKALSLGITEAIAEWGSFQCPEHKSQKNIDRVVQALDFYFQRWPIDSDPIKPYFWDERRPAVEFTFAQPLPILHPVTNQPLIYGGRSDLIGIMNDNIWIVDEKTTSQLGATWGTKWTLRGQFTGYVWAARKTGLPVAGAIVRGISFLKNSFGSAESVQFRPQWMVDAWYDQLLVDVQSMVDAWTSGKFPQAFADPCEEYGGCAFQDLCASANPESWTGKFTHRIWNPLNKYPSGKPDTEESSADVVPLGFNLY